MNEDKIASSIDNLTKELRRQYLEKELKELYRQYGLSHIWANGLGSKYLSEKICKIREDLALLDTPPATRDE